MRRVRCNGSSGCGRLCITIIKVFLVLYLMRSDSFDDLFMMLVGVFGLVFFLYVLCILSFAFPQWGITDAEIISSTPTSAENRELSKILLKA